MGVPKADTRPVKDFDLHDCVKVFVQWNLDLKTCQGTRNIGSLYRGPFPYTLKGRAEEYRSLYRGLRYGEVR